MRYLCLLLLCALFTFSPLLAQDDFQFETIEDFAAYIQRIVNADAGDGQAMVDSLWTYLTDTDQIPFVRDEDVAFLYRGEAETIAWVGDIVMWQADDALEGTRVGDTDLWVGVIEVFINARVEYRIIIDGSEDWIVDPANPHMVASGLHPNSELRMPLYTVTDVTQARDDVERGTATDELLFESAAMRYTLGYWVYTPVGYEDMDNLPVIYVLDGNDFLDEEMGRLIPALDNLIADRRIEPLIAVLINARDPNEPQTNRREDEFLGNQNYAQFVAEELIPLIDTEYRTNPTARVLLGVSYGGAGVAYIGVLYPELFAGVAPLSPSVWAVPELAEMYLAADVLPPRYFIGAGYPMWDNPIDQASLDMLAAKGVDVLCLTTMEGHSWATWRGLLDEMLMFFFGMRITE